METYGKTSMYNKVRNKIIPLLKQRRGWVCVGYSNGAVIEMRKELGDISHPFFWVCVLTAGYPGVWPLSPVPLPGLHSSQIETRFLDLSSFPPFYSVVYCMVTSPVQFTQKHSPGLIPSSTVKPLLVVFNPYQMEDIPASLPATVAATGLIEK